MPLSHISMKSFLVILKVSYEKWIYLDDFRWLVPRQVNHFIAIAAVLALFVTGAVVGGVVGGTRHKSSASSTTGSTSNTASSSTSTQTTSATPSPSAIIPRQNSSLAAVAWNISETVGQMRVYYQDESGYIQEATR